MDGLTPFHRLTVYDNKVSYCVLAKKVDNKLVDITKDICKNNLDLFDDIKITCICKKGRVVFEKRPVNIRLKIKDGFTNISKNVNCFKYICDVCNAASCETCFYLLKDIKGCQYCRGVIPVKMNDFIELKKEITEAKQKIIKLEIRLNELTK